MSRRDQRKIEKRKQTAKYIVVLYILLIFIFCVNKVSGKFLTNATGTATARVAKFSFVLKNTDNQVLSQNFEYDLAANITGGQNLSATGIVPGKSGKIDILIDITGGEVKTNYQVFLKAKQDIPNELNFYDNQEMTNEITIGDTNVLGGTINSNQEATMKTIYWKWNFNTNINENEYEGRNFLFDITVNIFQSDK